MKVKKIKTKKIMKDMQNKNKLNIENKKRFLKFDKNLQKLRRITINQEKN